MYDLPDSIMQFPVKPSYEDLQREVIALRQELVLRDAKIAKHEAELELLKRMLFGKRSEKMPRIATEIQKQDGLAPDKEQAQQKRQERRQARKQLLEVKILHTVAQDKRQCPHCHSTDVKVVGTGKESVVYEYVPPHFERQVHIQQTLSCSCGNYIVMAPGPTRPVEGGLYGARFIAHIVTAKCCDSIPLYRLAKQFSRIGILISRSTLGDLLHQAAQSLAPIWQHMGNLLPSNPLVLADETPIPVVDQGKTRTGYIWSFLAELFVYYRYSASRSGEVPQTVLGQSKGTLVVDGYSGYNAVCVPEGRTRSGCWAHKNQPTLKCGSNAGRPYWQKSNNGSSKNNYNICRNLPLAKQLAIPSIIGKR